MVGAVRRGGVIRRRRRDSDCRLVSPQRVPAHQRKPRQRPAPSLGRPGGGLVANRAARRANLPSRLRGWKARMRMGGWLHWSP